MNPWNGTVSTGLLLLAAAIVIFIVALLEYLLVRVSRAYSRIKMETSFMILFYNHALQNNQHHHTEKQLTSMKSSSSGTWDLSKGLVWVTIAWYWLAEPDTC